MKIYCHLFCCLVTAWLVTGCVPSERFWWSPGGDKTAVVVKGQLRITDSTGKTLVIPEFPGIDGESSIAEHVEWASDGKSLIAHRIRGFNTWDIAKPEFPADDVRRIEELADAIPAVTRTAIALGGDVDSIDAIFGRLRTKEPDHLRNAFYLSYEQDPEILRKILSGSPKLRAKLETGIADSRGYLLNQLDVVRLDSGEITPLLKTATLLTGPVLSPDGNRVLLGRRHGEKALVDLVSISIGNGTESPIAKRVFPAYAWQDDETVLALSPVADSESLLKQLKAFSFAPDREATTEILATALIPFLPRLEVLPDRSVLFSSQTGMLPTEATTTLPGSALFRYLPETRKLLRVPTPEGALPMNLGFFTASPDGSQVAIVESDTDAVAVVDISSGKVDLISLPRPNSKCRTLPAWRNTEELSFARLNEASREIEWVIWNRHGETRVLSEGWTAESTADWIERKKPNQN